MKQSEKKVIVSKIMNELGKSAYTKSSPVYQRVEKALLNKLSGYELDNLLVMLY